MNEEKEFPPITVVVSVYNKAEIVEKCISSLLEIDYPNWESLIIEGYSTDSSYEILRKFEDRIRILRVEGNYARALNRAFDEVKTDLLAITDADCVVERNWLKELVKGFSEGEDIIAVAGHVRKGKDLPLLATLIGIENEDKYKYFPKYLPRASTMNLCIRTDVARSIRFDERLQVAIETDFGYRLTKTGKMLYNPEAVVYHYTRDSWKSYFRQQVGFARGAFWVYLKHPRKIKGDHISTPGLVVQIPLFCLACLFMLLAVTSIYFLYASIALFLSLLIIYIRDILILPLEKRYYPLMIALFTIRTIALTTGALAGLRSFMAIPFRGLPEGKRW